MFVFKILKDYNEYFNRLNCRVNLLKLIKT